MICEKCGTNITTNMKFCKKCGVKLEEVGQVSNAGRSFLLSENEVEVKEYHCTTMGKSKGEGFVTITNKRVIYHGYGDNSRMLSEIHIEKITGVRTYYGKGYNIKQIVLGVIMILISIAAVSFFRSVINPVTIVLSILGIIMILNSKEVAYCFGISADGGNMSPVAIGGMGNEQNLTGQGAGLSIVAMPTEQTRIMMKELGAIILDFKNLGDYALEKWVANKNEYIVTNKNNIVELDVNQNKNDYTNEDASQNTNQDSIFFE